MNFEPVFAVVWATLPASPVTAPAPPVTAPAPLGATVGAVAFALFFSIVSINSFSFTFAVEPGLIRSAFFNSL